MEHTLNKCEHCYKKDHIGHSVCCKCNMSYFHKEKVSPSPKKEIKEKICEHAHCRCMEKDCTHFHYATCNAEFIEQERNRSKEKIEIVPSPRIDWCGNCQSEHGYDCPKDTPSPEPWEEEIRKLLGRLYQNPPTDEQMVYVFDFIRQQKAKSYEEGKAFALSIQKRCDNIVEEYIKPYVEKECLVAQKELAKEIVKDFIPENYANQTIFSELEHFLKEKHLLD